ncbi:MAG: hypothetical protein HON68_09110 [Gammaproteobacteria bacterium]|jgi:hypothetical protein|nr:hypothetical protein [Gammaproteobacteria bacterium]MBT3490045.1 hypothetical protein [Gammaproteobacteria bacterium]MBT3719519.1 hypothetical protein [Gammaproteobacteria bacterium]MBT3845973.1 hypothetical protein [Gammaproteobacteria bacterium]MBT3892936.1 hypothetical protein [Gammaproteobacteria bacterium]
MRECFQRLLFCGIFFSWGLASAAGQINISVGGQEYTVTNKQEAKVNLKRQHGEQVTRHRPGSLRTMDQGSAIHTNRKEFSGKVRSVMVEGDELHLKVIISPGIGRGYTVMKSESRNSLSRLSVRQQPNHTVMIKSRNSALSRLVSEIRMYLPKLEKLHVSGASDVSVEGVTGRRFDLELEGNGDVVVTGEVHQLKLVKRGAGSLDASRLLANYVVVTQSGNGDSLINPQQKVEGTHEGAGELFLFERNYTVNVSVKGEVNRMVGPVIR